MKLHHIAYVCKNVEQKAEYFCQILGFRKSTETIIDEYQSVKIMFLKSDDGTLIELLEPVGQNSPIKRYLSKNGGLYHLCFEVDDLEQTIQNVTKNKKSFLVKPPAQAPAIENRKVAFVVTDQADLIEFVETKS